MTYLGVFLGPKRVIWGCHMPIFKKGQKMTYLGVFFGPKRVIWGYLSGYFAKIKCILVMYI